MIEYFHFYYYRVHQKRTSYMLIVFCVKFCDKIIIFFFQRGLSFLKQHKIKLHLVWQCVCSLLITV